MVDSGTALIVGPAKDVGNLNGWVGAYTDQDGNVSFSESKAPDTVTIRITQYSSNMHQL